MIRVQVLGDSAAVVAELEEIVRGSDQLELIPGALDHAGTSGREWEGGPDVVLVEVDRWEHSPSDLDPTRSPGALTNGLWTLFAARGSLTHRLANSARIVLLMDSTVPLEAADALRRGAGAVLARDATDEQIVAAIQGVAAGLVALPVSLADPLLESLPVHGRAPAAPLPLPLLTHRELEVLALLAEGRGNKGIATRLGISPHTAKAHVASIFDKLGASTRAEAVAIGVKSGLVLL